MADWWEQEVDRVEDTHAKERGVTLGVRARDLANARHRLVKDYIWERVGPPLWIQGLFPVTITAVNTQAKTVSCMLEDQALDAVPYRDGPPPRAGEVWPLRRARDRRGATYDWIRTYGGLVLYYVGRDGIIRRLDWPPESDDLHVTEVMPSPSGWGWLGLLEGPRFVFVRAAGATRQVMIVDPDADSTVTSTVTADGELNRVTALMPNVEGLDIVGQAITNEGGFVTNWIVMGYVPGTNPAQPIWALNTTTTPQTRVKGIRSTLGGEWSTEIVTLGHVHQPIDQESFLTVYNASDTVPIGAGVWTVREEDDVRLGPDGAEISAYALAVNPTPHRGIVDVEPPTLRDFYGHTRLMVAVGGGSPREVPNVKAFPVMERLPVRFCAGALGGGRVFAAWNDERPLASEGTVGAWYDLASGESGQLPRTATEAVSRDGEHVIVQDYFTTGDYEPAPQYSTDGGQSWQDLPALPGLRTDPLYFTYGFFVEEGG